MAIFKSDEQRCLDSLKALHEARGRLATALHSHKADLGKLQSVDAGDATLEAFLATGSTTVTDSDGFPVSANARTGALEQKIQDLNAAKTALIRRYKAALLDLAKARAGVLRKQAGKLTSDLASHRSKVAALLADLEKTAGCRYRALLEPSGDSLFAKDGALLAHFSREEISVPISTQMERTIETLEAQVRKIEADGARAGEGGQVSGESLAELLTVAEDIERLAPMAAEIEQWFAEASARADAEWNVRVAEMGGNDYRGMRRSAPSRTVRYVLAWTDGSIDPQRSSATNIPVSGQSKVWNTAAASPKNSEPSVEVPYAAQW